MPLAFENALPSSNSESGFSIKDCISRRRNRTPYSGLNPFSVIKTFAFLVTVKLKPILLKLDKERREILSKVRGLGIISIILVALPFALIIELESLGDIG